MKRPSGHYDDGHHGDAAFAQDHPQERGERQEERGLKPPQEFYRPPSSNLSESVMALLMMTTKMIHRFAESRIARNKKYRKLSGPRMAVLFIVHHSGGIRMGDLAAKLYVAPRTVTDLIDGLEHDGFIKRVPDPKDRRASILELSESAKNDFEQIAEMRKSFVQEIFSPLSDDEKNQLITLLSKIQEGPIRDLLSHAVDEAKESK